MTPIELVIYAAACWYIAYAVTQTHGPFGVFVKLRDFKGGRWHGRYRKVIGTGKDSEGNIFDKVTIDDGLLDCIICAMFWLGQGMALVNHNSFIDGLAVAGVALWAHSYFGWRINMER